MHPRLFVLALALLAPAVHAEWRDIPYDKVAKMPLALAKIDPQHVYTVQLKAKPGKGQEALPTDFRLQVKVDGKVLPVPIGSGGRIDLPFRQDWVDAGAI